MSEEASLVEREEQKVIAQLRAEVTELQGELGKLREFFDAKMAVVRADIKSAFHKLGFNHVDATTKTNEVLGPEQ